MSISELNLRRQVLGRRNRLFVGNDDGAFANVTFVSLLASARLHGIQPHDYIRDVRYSSVPGGPIACSSSLPPTGSKLSSSPKLSKSCSPTSFDVSRFRRRPELAIAQHLYVVLARLDHDGSDRMDT